MTPVIQPSPRLVHSWGIAIHCAIKEAIGPILDEEDVNPENLAGGCAIAAFHLREKINQHGSGARFKFGQHASACSEDAVHCWTEHRGYIIDPTARQFGSNEQCVMTKKFFLKDQYFMTHSLTTSSVYLRQWGTANPFLYSLKWKSDSCCRLLLKN